MILVPTDFSDNSKPGLRFAIRLAARSKEPIVFVNVLQVKRPYQKDDHADSFEAKRRAQIDKTILKLESFVKKIYQSLKVEAGSYTCEVIEGLKPDFTIIDYCKKHPEINFIVMSTRGASYLNKTLGTNTGNLITQSSVPVIAVPKGYRYKPLRNVLYASDLSNLESEFERVLDFSKPRGLSVELLHFSSPSKEEVLNHFNKENLEFKAGYPLTIRILENNHSQPMVKNLQKQIEEIKPSLVILFTNQNRKFFEKIFLSSMAENLSFKSQTPLLVFNKE